MDSKQQFMGKICLAHFKASMRAPNKQQTYLYPLGSKARGDICWSYKLLSVDFGTRPPTMSLTMSLSGG